MVSSRPVVLVALEHGDGDEEVDNECDSADNSKTRVCVEIAGLHNPPPQLPDLSSSYPPLPLSSLQYADGTCS
jgi:hypothetical protein